MKLKRCNTPDTRVNLPLEAAGIGSTLPKRGPAKRKRGSRSIPNKVDRDIKGSGKGGEPTQNEHPRLERKEAGQHQRELKEEFKIRGIVLALSRPVKAQAGK